MTLSNQKAVFSVTLNYISETVLPTLNDEWVDASFGATDDIHTVADLEALCSELLTDANIKDYVMDYLMKNSEFKALPEVITDYQVNQCLNYYNTMAKYYGYGLEDFVKETARLRECRCPAGQHGRKPGALLPGGAAVPGRGREPVCYPHPGAAGPLLLLQ